jgi:hypothetical protein
MYRQFSKTTLKELRRKLNHESDPAFATSVDDPMTNDNFFWPKKLDSHLPGFLKILPNKSFFRNHYFECEDFLTL